MAANADRFGSCHVRMASPGIRPAARCRRRALGGSHERARPAGHSGPVTLQAAIAAEHARAASTGATNWRRVVDLYGELLEQVPSPTVALGRCVAVSALSGPAAGLADLDEVIGLGGLERYPYAFGARAQMLATLGRHGQARAEWTAAAECARTDAEHEANHAGFRVDGIVPHVGVEGEPDAGRLGVE